MASAFERQLKRLGLFGLSRLAKTPQTPPTPRDLDSVKEILVVRPDERIGNAILIIPLLNALKKRFPAARLTLIMSMRYWDLREFIPSVEDFIPFAKKRYARNPIALIGFIRRLRRKHFDLVFDASGDHSVSFTHLALTAFSGGRFRIGHDRGEAARTYEVAVPVTSTPRHETARHLDLLRTIAPGDYEVRPLLKPTPDTAFADCLWEKLGWSDDRPTVIIHPGARGRKRWPALLFAKVANRLYENRHQVGVLWGPGDIAAAEEMLQSTNAAVKQIGIIPFRDFVSVIRKADVFFSGDCGPMHVAAATPPRSGVVTVFTIDKSSRYGPLGPRDIAIVDDPDLARVDEIVAQISDLGDHRATVPAAGKVVA